MTKIISALCLLALYAVVQAQDEAPAVPEPVFKSRWWKWVNDNKFSNPKNFGRTPGPRDNINFESLSSFGDKGGAFYIDLPADKAPIEINSMILGDDSEIVLDGGVEVILSGYNDSESADLEIVPKEAFQMDTRCAINWQEVDAKNNFASIGNSGWEVPCMGSTVMWEHAGVQAVITGEMNIGAIKIGGSTITGDNAEQLDEIIDGHQIYIPGAAPNFDPEKCGMLQFGPNGAGSDKCKYGCKNFDNAGCPGNPSLSAADLLAEKIARLEELIAMQNEILNQLADEMEADKKTIETPVQVSVVIPVGTTWEVVEMTATSSPQKFEGYYAENPSYSFVHAPTICCAKYQSKTTEGCDFFPNPPLNSVTCRSIVTLPEIAKQVDFITVYRNIIKSQLVIHQKEIELAPLEAELKLGYSEHCFTSNGGALGRHDSPDFLAKELQTHFGEDITVKMAHVMKATLSITVVNPTSSATLSNLLKTFVSAEDNRIYGENTKVGCPTEIVLTVEHDGLGAALTGGDNVYLIEVIENVTTFVESYAASQQAGSYDFYVQLDLTTGRRRATSVDVTVQGVGANLLDENALSGFTLNGETAGTGSVTPTPTPTQQVQEESETQQEQLQTDIEDATPEAPGPCGLESTLRAHTYSFTGTSNLGVLDFVPDDQSYQNSLTIGDAKATVTKHSAGSNPFKALWTATAADMRVMLGQIVGAECFVITEPLKYHATNPALEADYDEAHYSLATMSINGDSSKTSGLGPVDVKAAMERALQIQTIKALLANNVEQKSSAEAALASMNKTSGGGMNMIIIAAAAAAVVLLLAIAIIVYKKRQQPPRERTVKEQTRKSTRARKATMDRAVVAFENPMYDTPAQNDLPVYDNNTLGDDEGLYDEPAFADNLTKENPLYSSQDQLATYDDADDDEHDMGGGYLDVAPDAGDDDDDDDAPDDAGYLEQSPDDEPLYGEADETENVDEPMYGEADESEMFDEPMYDDGDAGYLEQTPEDE